MSIVFDNSYFHQLSGFYTPWQAADFPNPEMLLFNADLARELGLEDLQSEPPEVFAGTQVLAGSEPLAQAYAGHQFGGFSPQLGDGRALLLGEFLTPSGARRDMQLKGSGRTPYSRGGDGKAAVGPVLREYLIGEAMHALGIPTTRALAAVTTGEKIHRERALPGAVLTRIAASHIRVGTFQFFAARNEMDKVRQLADYTIARHHPELQDADNPYISLLSAVSHSQASLVSRWMSVGFIHGVMNTDNMALSGETIDYGPCAFMDHYDPKTVFSSIDTGGRYAYANQPLIARWNLARLAETLLPLIDTEQARAIDKATAVINDFAEYYARQWLRDMRPKIGLTSEKESDLDLANEFLQTLEGRKVDFTNIFRTLATIRRDQADDLPVSLTTSEKFQSWLLKWKRRLEQEATDPRAGAEAMDRVNPLYIPRNHKVEEALTAAVDLADLTVFKRLLEVVKQPFTRRDGQEEFEGPNPDDAPQYKTFCGT